MSNFWRCCSRDNHDEWKHCPCCGKPRPTAATGPSEEDKRAMGELGGILFGMNPDYNPFDKWLAVDQNLVIRLYTKAHEICGKEAADMRDKLAKKGEECAYLLNKLESKEADAHKLEIRLQSAKAEIAKLKAQPAAQAPKASGLPAIGERVDLMGDRSAARVCGHAFWVKGSDGEPEFHRSEFEGQTWRRATPNPNRLTCEEVGCDCVERAAAWDAASAAAATPEQPAQSRTANLEREFDNQPSPTDGDTLWEIWAEDILKAANADIDAAVAPLQKRIAELGDQVAQLQAACSGWTEITEALKTSIAELEAQAREGIDAIRKVAHATGVPYGPIDEVVEEVKRGNLALYRLAELEEQLAAREGK